MQYIVWLLNYEFLYFKGGFWFIALPFFTLCIYSNYYIYKRKKEEQENEDLPLENIILNLSKEEKWMLDNLIKKSESGNLDNYITKILKNIK